MKILDCTLRDGGYYTNWDFSQDLVDSYLQAMNLLPVDYIEVGYRNNPSDEYMGEYAFTPVSVLKHIRSVCHKKLTVMLNEKSTLPDDLDHLLVPIVGLVDMIRIAVDPKNFNRAVVLAKAIKALGFEVGFNVMYMSKWRTEHSDFISHLNEIDGIVDLFCMVDSFGGITPEEVEEIYKDVKENTRCTIGFHGHNNLQLGLINSVTAMKLGVGFVDATILGMGRGAGNLSLELLLTYLNAHNGLSVDFNILGDVISAFTPLYEKHRWGTNLPYMLAGANKIPQKEVMSWVTNRRYSFNSIVRALNNRKDHSEDNARFPLIQIDKKYDTVIVVGGGDSATLHSKAIKQFIQKEQNVALVFATTRQAHPYNDVSADKYYCLVGNESRRFADIVGNNLSANETCVLAPYPRLMGTDVPDFAYGKTVELPSVEFTDLYKDSVTSIALQLALDLSSKQLFLIGYDGYPGNILSEKEIDLTHENQYLFKKYEHFCQHKPVSLTPTLYRDLSVNSIYQLI